MASLFFCAGTAHRRARWLAFALCLLPSLAAAENVWRSSTGKTGFFEKSNVSGELIAGTEWEDSLVPGYVYGVNFRVRKLSGHVGLLVGDLPVIPIESTGTYSFSFFVSDSGARRMMFQSLSDSVTVRVSEVKVARKWRARAGSDSLPKGHYWSFPVERDLHAEMVVPLQNPGATTAYRLALAQNLHDALTTPGVRGLWMPVDWRTVEIGNGVYDWRLIDANMQVGGQYGLKVIVQVSDRSSDGSNPMPDYLSDEYAIPYGGKRLNGYVAKRWDPYVYKRMIRLYSAIAARYRNYPAFGGIATSEMALGELQGGDYSVNAYVNALIQLATEGQMVLRGERLLFYLNFLTDGTHIDMNRDLRPSLLQDVPHASLLIGAPDITPDIKGVVRSLSPYRVHIRDRLPGLGQFCHLQHIDQGHQGLNVKSNEHREDYLREVEALREREQQPGFSGDPGVFAFDDVGLHALDTLGALWQPQELLDFGQRNFGCDHVLWHYRDGSHWTGSVWTDIREVMLQNQDL